MNREKTIILDAWEQQSDRNSEASRDTLRAYSKVRQTLPVEPSLCGQM